MTIPERTKQPSLYLLNATQIREWDQFTIEQERIHSIDLMERAANKCAQWILAQNWIHHPFKIFCGKGNNGGDGLALARFLILKGYQVRIYILEFGKSGTPNFQKNLERLHEISFTDIHFIQQVAHFPMISEQEILVDALFGSGLKGPLQDLPASLVSHINLAPAKRIAIDLPSGMPVDDFFVSDHIIRATFTLSFQCFKLAFLLPEYGKFTGEVVLLDIGLHPDFPSLRSLNGQLITSDCCSSMYRPRHRYAHKGDFGHMLLLAGSFGKIGAAVLSAKAAIRSGAGLLTCNIPRCGYTVMQTSVPEAMVIADDDENIISELPVEIEKYQVIALGPGIGTRDETQKLISFLIRRFEKPLVIDADGLNCISLNKDLLQQLPAGSIITPHPKEFDRLFGAHDYTIDRIRTAQVRSKELDIIIVLKGHHTAVFAPQGDLYFNLNGNAGMAKGGSGDVLTGVIGSLLAQGYSSIQAAVLGVYLHGLAGDMAAQQLSQESMIPSDIIESLSLAFRDMASRYQGD